MTTVKFRDDNEVSLEDFMGGDDRACMSAWVSFGNDDQARLEDRKKVKGLINFLYSNKHMTPFESTVFTFRIKTPIFVAREYFRHRSASYNEWSGRYSVMVPEFYIPRPERPLIQEGKPGDYYFVPGSDEQYALVRANQENSCKVAWKAYEDVLAAGVAKEVARNILPLNTYTYFYVTMNARNLMHFLLLRNEFHALDEIQDVARQMEEFFAEKMPLTYGVYRRVREESENSIVIDTTNPTKAREQIADALRQLNLVVLNGRVQERMPLVGDNTRHGVFSANETRDQLGLPPIG